MPAAVLNYLPLWGFVVIVLAAARLRGPARRMTLTIAPFVLGVAMWWVMPTLRSPDGNWLRDMFVLAVYGFGFLALGVYYVLLLVTAVGMWLRRNEALRRAARDGDSVDATDAEPV